MGRKISLPFFLKRVARGLSIYSKGLPPGDWECADHSAPLLPYFDERTGMFIFADDTTLHVQNSKRELAPENLQPVDSRLYKS